MTTTMLAGVMLIALLCGIALGLAVPPVEPKQHPLDGPTGRLVDEGDLR